MVPVKRTARELADHLEASMSGDDTAALSGVASPERAAPEDLIYVDSVRHIDRARNSRAKCVIAPPGLELEGKTAICADQPKLAFARAAAWLLESPVPARGAQPPQVHSTALVASSARLDSGVLIGPFAVVEDEVEIGPGSQIGAYCFLGAGVRIGELCRLHPRVTLYEGARLGDRVVIHSGAVIGSDGFGYVRGDNRYWKFPQVGQVEIESDVEIGANTTVDRGALDTTRVGAGTKIDNLVQVAHNVDIGRHSVIAAQTGISGSSRIGNDAVIGGQVGIADHCILGDGVVAGAQAGIPTGKHIRAGQVVWGTPARPLEKFKQQYAWISRLPELGARMRELGRK